MEPHDPLPGVMANVDQAVASAPHLARLARGLYDAYIAVGFKEPQALYLTACQLHQTPGPAT